MDVRFKLAPYGRLNVLSPLLPPQHCQGTMYKCAGQNNAVAAQRTDIELFYFGALDLARKKHDQKPGDGHGADIGKCDDGLRRETGNDRIGPPADRQRQQMYGRNNQDRRRAQSIVAVSFANEYRDHTKRDGKNRNTFRDHFVPSHENHASTPRKITGNAQGYYYTVPPKAATTKQASEAGGFARNNDFGLCAGAHASHAQDRVSGV